MQSTQTASLDSCKCPCFSVYLIVVSSINPFHNSIGKTNKEPRKESFANIVWHCDLVEPLWIFSVRLTVSEVFKSFWDCPGVVSTTCCHCDIIWCVCDVILCDSSLESSALRPFAFMTSSSALRSFNRLTIIRSRS